jgi:hypothetical protein
MHQYNAGTLLEMIPNDIPESFPRSDQGNPYLMIDMEYSTKWPEAYAIPNQETSAVVEGLVSKFLRRSGVPLELHSDEGRNFESRLMQDFCNASG